MSNLKDFATGTVKTAPNPKNSGTTLVLNSGEGLRMPITPFSATAHPSHEAPTLDNAEKIQVTNVVGDTLTFIRGQGDTTPKDIDIDWRISNSLFLADLPTKTSDLTNNSGFITEEDIPPIPTKTSELTNDSDFITSEDIPDTSTTITELTYDYALTEKYRYTFTRDADGVIINIEKELL